jgi:short-subunit dehydrogenase
VVANAGVAAGGTLLLADPASYDRVVEVNLLGSIRTVRAFLPALVASRGYVLQVASLAAMVPAPPMSAYCASKSGVEAFAHALRGEVAHHGVEVGIACLSRTHTDMVRGADTRPTGGAQRG